MFRDDVYKAGLLDCKNTTSINGLGAATENLVLKAHELKLEVITEVLPNLDENSKLIAVIRFFDNIDPKFANKFESHVCDDLVSTIPLRLTNRNIVERKKIEIERLLVLKKLAQTVEGADLIIIDDEKNGIVALKILIEKDFTTMRMGREMYQRKILLVRSKIMAFS